MNIIDDKLQVIIKSNFGAICDGKNNSFCFLLKKDGQYSEKWRDWWLDFSRLRQTDWQGKPFPYLVLEDYNFLKMGIFAGWLLVKAEEWEGIKVCFLLIYTTKQISYYVGNIFIYNKYFLVEKSFSSGNSLMFGNLFHLRKSFILGNLFLVGKSFSFEKIFFLLENLFHLRNSFLGEISF